MSDNKTIELFTMGIVVIESLWPRITDGPGDERPKLVGPDTTTTNSIYKYSSNQNEFSGYFKILPLNLFNLTTDSSRNGHNFSIQFDASLLYVEVDANSVSDQVISMLNNISIPNGLASANIFLGILKGYSSDAFSSSNTQNIRKFVIPGSSLSNFVSEMDTVTIFMINESRDFIEDEIIKLYTGSLSRINEKTTTLAGRRLSNLGISSFRENLQTDSVLQDILINENSEITNVENFKEIVTVLRDYMSNTGIFYSRVNTSNVINNLYISNNTKEERVEVSNAELQEIKQFSDTNETENNNTTQTSDVANTTTTNYLSGYLANNYINKLRQEDANFISIIESEINEYYSVQNLGTTNRLSYILPWSAYKTIYLIVEETLGNQDVFGDEDIKAIVTTIALDLIMSEKSNLTYNISSINNNAYEQIAANVENINQEYNLEENSFLLEDYVYGATTFANGINTYIAEAQAEQSEQSFYETDYLTAQDLASSNYVPSFINLDDENAQLTLQQLLDLQNLEDLRVPISSHTPALILKGHIGSISYSSAISGNSYQKTITISGQGFELPLKRHAIFYDQIQREKSFFINYLNLAVTQFSPIRAALNVMDIFMPEYVSVVNANAQQIQDAYENLRYASLYNNRSGLSVSQGNVIYPSPSSSVEEALIYTPIHYVDLSYLRSINSTFEDVNIAEEIRLNSLQTLSQNSVYANLNKYLGQTSLYSWFVDEFGFLKVRYETAAASLPYSTILSPVITDENIISINTSTNESSIFTVVEVVPHTLSFNAPSGGAIPGIFGRATPPSIENWFSDLQSINLDFSDPKYRYDIIKFFTIALEAYQSYLISALDIFKINNDSEFVDSLNLPTEIINDSLAAVRYASYYQDTFQIYSDAAVGYTNNYGNSSYDNSQGSFGWEDGSADENAAPNPQGPYDPAYLPANYDLSKLDSKGQSRSLDDLHPELKNLFDAAVADYLQTYANESPLVPQVSCTFRTKEAQEAFYAQGKSNALWGGSPHNFYPALAVDVFFNDNGTASYADIPRFAEIFKKYGVEWGGDWANFYDGPHFQAPNFSANLVAQGQPIDWGPSATLNQNVISVLPGGLAPRSATPSAANVTNPITLDESNVFDMQNFVLPESLKTLYVSNISAIDPLIDVITGTNNSIDYLNRYKDRFAIFVLNEAIFNNQLYEVENTASSVYSDNTTTVKSTLIDYIANNVLAAVSAADFTQLGDVFSFTNSGKYDLLNYLTTMAAFGIETENFSGVLDANTIQGTVLRALLSGITLEVSVENLRQFPTSYAALAGNFNKILPYENLSLQESYPSQISADLFRYGIRVYRVDDYYLSTISFTDFRAEATRKMYEKPIRSANVKLIGNPIYKMGNTVLTVTRHIDDRRYNYINAGTLKTLKQLDKKNRNIICKVDDQILNGYVPIPKNELFGLNNDANIDSAINEDSIYDHFISAYEFILNRSNGPISTAAYVPLFNAYKNPELTEYLSLLTLLNFAEFEEDYTFIETSMKREIFRLTELYYGANNVNTKNITNLLNILAPQTYHVYQYYIQSVKNSYQFMNSYTTSLDLNFGLGASLCYINKANDVFDDFFILGYLLNDSPFMPYYSSGVINKKLPVDHPLYNFVVNQHDDEQNFYIQSQRYNVARIIDRLRKKIEYPDLNWTNLS